MTSLDDRFGVTDDPAAGPAPGGLRNRLLGTIAEVNLLRIIPALHEHLLAMRGYVAKMTDEVTAMNASVSRIEPEMIALIQRVEAIERRTAGMEDTMARLEGHLRDLDRSLHPLSRALGRRGARGRPEHGPLADG
jgi:predicted nuclease with TOPRIM domain